MKRAICILSLACVGFAQAQTVIDDFSAGSNPYVLPTDGNFGTNPSNLSGPLFDVRNLSGSGYVGNGMDTFTSALSGGMLTSQGVGTAGGELDLSYTNSMGETDLSGYRSVTVTFSRLSAPVHLGWGFFSNGYSSESGNGFTVNSAGSVTLDFADLGGDALVASKVESLFIDVDVAAGQSISISHITANAVPEPAPFAALALGLLAFRRRKSA